jgi:hypothetical protein
VAVRQCYLHIIAISTLNFYKYSLYFAFFPFLSPSLPSTSSSLFLPYTPLFPVCISCFLGVQVGLAFFSALVCFRGTLHATIRVDGHRLFSCLVGGLLSVSHGGCCVSFHVPDGIYKYLYNKYGRGVGGWLEEKLDSECGMVWAKQHASLTASSADAVHFKVSASEVHIHWILEEIRGNGMG